jgi:hypothetical protein
MNATEPTASGLGKPPVSIGLLIGVVVVFLGSLALPAVMDPERQFLGIEAFFWSFLMIIGFPIGSILSLTNVIYAVNFLALVAEQRWSFFTSLVLVLLMCLWPTQVPDRPSGELIRGIGGQMGPGYYLWVLSGLLMLVESVLINSRVYKRRHELQE